MMQIKPVTVIVIAAVIILGLSSVFTVDEREYALKLRLGEIIRSDYDAGLHFKTPFINNVRKFERRIQTLDARPERFLTVEMKNLDVDFFVKWRVGDPERFYTATRGGDSARANELLRRIVLDGLRSEFGKRTIQEAISGERAAIMSLVTRDANLKADEIGVTVVDVRFKRIDLPPEVSESVYQRMEAERERIARQLRAEGSEAAERIRADAERQRTIIIAEAYREAETLRGQADARATAIYAAAYGSNQEFYAFYRSLEAYRQSFSKGRDLLLLEPEGDFFKYLKDPQPRR